MMETAPERVVDLIREGRKIEAVKIVREQTGASLKDALQVVEQMERERRERADPMPEVQALALEGRAVEAIALLRERTGLGLKEAKDVVDALPRPEVAVAPPIVAIVIAVTLLVVGAVMAVVLVA